MAIARVLGPGTKLVIFDEPTAALAVSQTRKVLENVRAIAEQGKGVILVAHDIETVFAIADRIVVLRLGRVVHDGPANEVTELQLVGLMAGVSTSSPVGSPRKAMA